MALASDLIKDQVGNEERILIAEPAQTAEIGVSAGADEGVSLGIKKAALSITLPFY